MAARKEMSQEHEVTHGSDNIFTDLELPDAEVLLAKANLAVAITTIMQEMKLSHKKAAKQMEIQEADVVSILHGRMFDFPTEKLLACLFKLGSNIEIVIHESVKKIDRVGEIRVDYRASSPPKPKPALKSPSK